MAAAAAAPECRGRRHLAANRSRRARKSSVPSSMSRKSTLRLVRRIPLSLIALSSSQASPAVIRSSPTRAHTSSSLELVSSGGTVNL